MATVVVLNGTSSSGKTRVARAFRDLAPSLFLNFSIDSILQTLPPKAIARVERSEDISDLRFPELARAFHACVRELLALGHDVITDNAITARHQAELLVAAVEGHDVLLVGRLPRRGAGGTAGAARRPATRARCTAGERNPSVARDADVALPRSFANAKRAWQTLRGKRILTECGRSFLAC